LLGQGKGEELNWTWTCFLFTLKFSMKQ
jgi:hypothetical protein